MCALNLLITTGISRRLSSCCQFTRSIQPPQGLCCFKKWKFIPVSKNVWTLCKCMDVSIWTSLKTITTVTMWPQSLQHHITWSVANFLNRTRPTELANVTWLDWKKSNSTYSGSSCSLFFWLYISFQAQKHSLGWMEEMILFWRFSAGCVSKTMYFSRGHCLGIVLTKTREMNVVNYLRGMLIER